MTASFHTTTSATGAVTVTAVGEIDLATAGQFRDCLVHAGAGDDLITIDLTAVDYVDSAGIRVLYEFVASHTLELLVAPSTIPAAALGVSGLLDVVTVRQPGTDPAGEGGVSR